MKKNNPLMLLILAVCFAGTAMGVFSLLSGDGNGTTTLKQSDLNLFNPVGDSRPGIGIVKVYGPIFTETETSFLGISERGCDAIVKQLKKMKDDDRVKAVVLRINSPGGTIGASQEITNAVIDLQQSGKKVIASMGDVAASGGYYIAAYADKIVANKGTITGSIGVISAALNFSGLMEKYGVKMNVIKQGKNKDLFAYWRDMTDEEREILEAMSKNAYEQFVEAVSKGRNIPMNELLEIADGRILTGAQALQVRLVDELGGMNEAVRIAATEVGLNPESPHLIDANDAGFKRFFDYIGTESIADRYDAFFRMLMHQPVPFLYYSTVPMPFYQGMISQ